MTGLAIVPASLAGWSFRPRDGEGDSGVSRTCSDVLILWENSCLLAASMFSVLEG